MNDPFFVAFIQGSSGRFISNIIWQLVSDYSKELEYSQYNSAHLENMCCQYWDTSNMVDPTWDKDGYETISFTNNQVVNVFFSHTYPNFERVFLKYPNSKFIIISIDDNDYYEIAGNYVFKNGLEKTCFIDRLPDRIVLIYKKLYEKTIDITHEFTDTEIREIVNFYGKNMLYVPYGKEYTNCVVPDKFLDKILLIKYGDIFKQDAHGNFITYDKLKTFTNTLGNINILNNYKNYVEGRKKFINQYLPWINNT
jgi:hypothetical protein